MIRSDAEDLPFGDSSFDFVWSWGVIHHTPNTWLAVDEIHRVLREGGQTRVMVYHRHSVKYWLYTVLLKGILGLELLHLSRQELLNRYSDGHIAQYFSRSEAIELFRKFSDIEVLVRGQRSEALPKLHRRIDVGEHWFDPVVRIVTDNFGVFLIVCATK